MSSWGEGEKGGKNNIKIFILSNQKSKLPFTVMGNSARRTFWGWGQDPLFVSVPITMSMKHHRRASGKPLNMRDWSSGERSGQKEKCGSCQHAESECSQLDKNTFRSKKYIHYSFGQGFQSRLLALLVQYFLIFKICHEMYTVTSYLP